MTLSVSTYTLGPIQNNCYLVYDPESKEAIVVDPPPGAKVILDEVQQKTLTLKGIWLTHAHFDHMGGAAELVKAVDYPLPVGLHKQELMLYQNDGYAKSFGFNIPKQPDPTLFFEHGQLLSIGSFQIEVRHCPGHSSGGQIIFYAPDASAAFCGDVIFHHSIGRTDLPGGDHKTLLNSIRTQIMTLPPETQLLCGHGNSSTVSEEMEKNPFL